MYLVSCILTAKHNSSLYIGTVSPKSGTLDFRYFEIRKCCIFWLHQKKTLCLLKRMVPRSFWFGSAVLILQPFPKRQSFTNFCMTCASYLLCMGIDVDALFALFIWIDGRPGSESAIPKPFSYGACISLWRSIEKNGKKKVLA